MQERRIAEMLLAIQIAVLLSAGAAGIREWHELDQAPRMVWMAADEPSEPFDPFAEPRLVNARGTAAFAVGGYVDAPPLGPIDPPPKRPLSN
jgi:hypothetical protein